MFSATLEMVLSVAYREALSRRHAHLTLEHLLYAIAHDPAGEEILQACGGRPGPPARGAERVPRDLAGEAAPRRGGEPTQTLAFRRVLQTAVLHTQSAGREEANVGDVLAAIMQQPKSQAAQLLAAQGVTRLDVLNFISHGVTKVPLAAAARGARPRRRRRGAHRRARPALRLCGEPHRARARGDARPAGGPARRDPARAGGALPPAQEQPRVRGRGRGRQDRAGGRAGPAPAGRGRAAAS